MFDYLEQFRGDPPLHRISIKPSRIRQGLSWGLAHTVYMPVDENGSVYYKGSMLGLWVNVEYEGHNAAFPDNPEEARLHAPELCIFEDD